MNSVQKRVFFAILGILAVIILLLLGAVAVIAGEVLTEDHLIKLLSFSLVLFILLTIISIFVSQVIVKLQNQLETIDAANKAKSNFLANMSHEIRTPINAILGMDEMIIRESVDEQIVEYATNIKQAGKSLLAQVNGILDYSKLEGGKMEIISAEYDLATMINSVVPSVATRTKAKGLAFKTEVDNNLPMTLLGDDVRVSQILMNLLTNALKYTETGEILFSMKEVSRIDNSINIEVCVKDTGIGIKPEDLEDLYVSFKRIDEERNRNIEGTGLGIPIVIQLLKLMGSELQVESEYGLGSKFSFVITQGIVNSEPVGDYKKRIKKSYKRRNKFTFPSMPTASILVVDDYEMNLIVAKNLMKIYDFIPDLASSGNAAIAKTAEKQYDIIFMDHMMPDLDGLQTIELMKERGLLTDKTAVIALTANAIAGAKEYYLSKGCDDYLTKPIDAEALEDMLLKFVPKEKMVNKPISDIKHDKSLTTNDDERQALIKIFVSTIDEIAKKLDEFIAASDIKNYTIKVHGLKSTARLIGEMSISKKAEALEKAGNAGDWDYILENHKELISEYLSIRDNYEGKSKSKQPLEESDLKDALYSIIEMANVADFASTEMVLDKLDEYEIPEDISEKIKNIRRLLEKLEYELVAKAATEMLGGN
ncbi:MAG: response regulator [Pseudobutyrivibrio sp.]|nr:response regulator [Pseudobutyrivibrio sp.]